MTTATHAPRFERRGPAQRRLGRVDRTKLDALVTAGELMAIETLSGQRMYDTGSYIQQKLREGFVLLPLDGARPDDLSLVKPTP